MVFDYRDGNHNAYMGPPEVRYKSLRNPHTRIRLAYLHAGSWSDPIAVTLRVHVRSDQPIYVALSYTWGRSTAGHSMLLNGSDFPVTDNLFAALRRLRLSNRSRVLWIDAICINQADPIERAAQIKAMQSIYHGAVRVIIWLGDSTAVSTTHTDASRDKHRVVPAKDVSSTEKLGQSLTSTRPLWHERIWTLQEFISARKDPIFLYQDESWSLSRMQHILSQSTTINSSGFSRRIEAFAQALTTRQQVLSSLTNDHTSPIDDFLILCLATTGTQASDPLDHVYGILNLLSRQIAGRIKVSYNTTPTALFTMSTRAAVNGTRSLVPLALKRLQPARSIVASASKWPDLPSWALDFSDVADIRSTSTGTRLGYSAQATLQDQLCDGVAVNLHDLYDIDSEPVPHLLFLEGILYDRIRDIVPLRLLSLAPRDSSSRIFWPSRWVHSARAATSLKSRRIARGSTVRSAILRSYMTIGNENRILPSNERFIAVLDEILEVKECEGAKMHPVHLHGTPATYSSFTTTSDNGLQADLEYWLGYLTAVSQHAVLFTTDTGRCGLASSAVQVGDKLASLPSMKASVVLSNMGKASTRLYKEVLERSEIEEPQLYGFRGFAYVYDAPGFVDARYSHEEGRRERILLA